MSKFILQRLNLSQDITNEICELIKYHDTKITSLPIEKTEEFINKLYKIQYCDALAHNPNKLESRKKYLYDMKIKLKFL